jgi:hypothetical protein
MSRVGRKVVEFHRDQSKSVEREGSALRRGRPLL